MQILGLTDYINHGDKSSYDKSNLSHNTKDILQVVRNSNLKLVENVEAWGAWLTQLEEHVTIDLGVMGLSPMQRVEITLKKSKLLKKLNQKEKRKKKL